MNTTLKYGLIGGLILSSFNIFYFFDLYQYNLFNKFWMVFKLLTLVIVILLGIKEKKQKDNNEINYRDAIFTGLSINLVAGLILSFSLFVIFRFSPALLNAFRTHTLQIYETQLKAQNFKPEEIKKYINSVTSAFDPFTMAKDSLMQILLIGLIFTLAIAFFQRNKTGNTPSSIKA